MSWFKRYVIGILVAVVVFTAVDRSHRPDQEMYGDAIILCAIGWPVVTAIVLGSTIGDIINDIKQGK